VRWKWRGIRMATMAIAVALCAGLFGLCEQVYQTWSPVRRWIRESRPGNPQSMRLQAVVNLTYDVPGPELETAFPFLLEAANDADPLVRAQAAMALRGRIDHFEQVVSILRGMMRDPAPQVRESAIFNVQAFVKRSSPEAADLFPDLVTALDDSQPAVALEACRALYSYGRLQAESRRVVPAMARLVRAKEGTYRQDALGYLMFIRSVPRDLESTLRGLLDHVSVPERIMARRALIQLGIPDQERDAIIRSMLTSTNNTERMAAAYLLVDFGKPVPAISSVKDVAEGADSAMRERAPDWLLRMLNGPGNTARLVAAEALIDLGNPEAAIPALKEIAAVADKEARERAGRLLMSAQGGSQP
jgi:HEAT repeat protein